MKQNDRVSRRLRTFIGMDELSILRDELPDSEFEELLAQMGISSQEYAQMEEEYERNSI